MDVRVIRQALATALCLAHRAATTLDRSPKWAAFRRRWIYGDRKAKAPAHRRCLACQTKLLPEAHHVEPFEHNPARELDATNLATLCHFRACHLKLGHGSDFHFYVPRVLWFCQQVRDGWLTLEEAAAMAKEERKPIRQSG